MAFKTPRLFPGSFCWKESEVDPLTIIYSTPFGTSKPYSFACTLEQAMELYWIGQVFSLYGVISVFNQSGGGLIYTTIADGVNTPVENYAGTLNRMSEVLCFNFNTDNEFARGSYAFQITSGQQAGEPTEFAGSLGLGLRRTSFDLSQDYRILKYNDMWYPLLSVGVGGAGAGSLFTYVPPSQGGSANVTIRFSDNSIVQGVAINVTQFPSTISGSIEVRIEKFRQNA